MPERSKPQMPDALPVFVAVDADATIRRLQLLSAAAPRLRARDATSSEMSASALADLLSLDQLIAAMRLKMQAEGLGGHDMAMRVLDGAYDHKGISETVPVEALVEILRVKMYNEGIPAQRVREMLGGGTDATPAPAAPRRTPGARLMRAFRRIIGRRT